jgi:hypothetical protein
LIDTTSINQDILDSLPSDDYEYFEHLVFRSGLRIFLRYKTRSNQSIEDKKTHWLNQYRVTFGEIQAGNDDPPMWYLLRDTIIPGMRETGGITQDQYDGMMLSVLDVIRTK